MSTREKRELWRWADSQGAQRWVHTDELRSAIASRKLPPYILVWTQGMLDWAPAHEVAEFATVALATQDGSVPTVPPPPLSMIKVQAAFERRDLQELHQLNENSSSPPSQEPPPPPVERYRSLAPLTSPPVKRVFTTEVLTTLPSPHTAGPIRSALSVNLPNDDMLTSTPHSPIAPPRTAPTTDAPPPHLDVGSDVPIDDDDLAEDEAETWVARPVSAPPPPPRSLVPPRRTDRPAPALPPSMGALRAPPPPPLSSRGMSAAVSGAPPRSVRPPPPPPPPPPPSTRSPIAPRALLISGNASVAPPPPAAEMLELPPLFSLQQEHDASPDEPDLFTRVTDEFAPPPFEPPPQDPRLAPVDTPSRDVATGLSNPPPNLSGATDRRGPNIKGVMAVSGLCVAALIAVNVVQGRREAAGSHAERPESAAPPAEPAIAKSEPAVDQNAAVAAVAPSSAPRAAGSQGACIVSGEPVRLAPKAIKEVPLELVASGGRVYVGFSPAPTVASAISIGVGKGLEPRRELLTKGRVRVKSVVPMVGKRLTYFVTVDNRSDKLRSSRPLSATPPRFVGAAEGGIAIAAKLADAPRQLWSLDGAPQVDVVRTVAVADQGNLVVLRRGSGIFAGWIDATESAKGELAPIPTAGGPVVGAPSAGFNGQQIAILFADRANGADPWGLRLGRAMPGALPTETVPLELPAGGPGGGAIAPAITGMSDGRWLVVWTEGSGANHDVRGVTLSADFTQIGAALTLSRGGSNAGQGGATVADGKGLVAYLSATPEGYELWGSAVECP